MYRPLLCSIIVQWIVNLKLPHIIYPLKRAINVMSDDRNCVKYKRTIQHSEQLWPHKLDWWWSHHTWGIRNIAVPPAIEMQVVTERMLIKVLFFITFLIEQLITNVQYAIKRVYKISKTNLFVFFCEFFMLARDLILFYWEFYESQNHRECRRLNTTFYFFI
jgi:hypothetical protein